MLLFNGSKSYQLCDSMHYRTPGSSVLNYWNLLKFMSIELVVLSVISGFKLCHHVVLELWCMDSLRPWLSLGTEWQVNAMPWHFQDRYRGIIEHTILCLDDRVSFPWNAGSKSVHPEEHHHVVRTSLPFSMKAFWAQSILHHVLVLWVSVVLTVVCLTALMVLYYLIM